MLLNLVIYRNRLKWSSDMFSTKFVNVHERKVELKVGQIIRFKQNIKIYI